MKKKYYFEWHSILRDILRNAFVIVCACIIGLMGTYIAKHLVYKPMYTSSASLIINSAAGKANAVSSLSQSTEIAEIYTQVFTQPAMKEKVCEYLGRESFNGTIKAFVNKGTNIMEISVSANDPEDSYKELKAILKVYPKLTASLFTNGAVSVLKAPALPKAPSNSITRGNLFRNAFIAMLLALILIVVISVTRDTVKDEESFAEKIDADLVGTIPHESKHLTLRQIINNEKRGLLIDGNTFTGLKFSENFSKIATKLEYLKKTKGENVFCITSVAENEGKSTVSSNIAIALAQKGNRVILMDLDGKKPALYKIFEEKYDENSEFYNYISGKIPASEYKFRRYRKTRLFLALNTEYHSDYQGYIENGRISKMLKGFAKRCDFVIIDTAPCSVDSSVTGTASFCDETILVVRTDSVYAPIINDTLLTFENTGAKVMGCILNDCYDELSLLGQMGTDESGYSFTGRYGGYGNYGKYEKYGKYGRYGKYGNYGKYGKYGRYGSHIGSDTDDDDFDENEVIATNYEDEEADV